MEIFKKLAAAPIVLASLWLVTYVLRSIGLYKIAKNQKITRKWRAFIPFWRTALTGQIAGNVTVGKARMEKPGPWMILLPFLIVGLLLVLALLSAVILIRQTEMMEQLGIYRPDSSFLPGMALFGLLFVLVLFVGGTVVCTLKGLVNFQIYKKLNDTTAALLHMLLGLFVPFYQSVYFFVLGVRAARTVPEEEEPTTVEEPVAEEES
jgi:hypothetical protein